VGKEEEDEENAFRVTQLYSKRQLGGKERREEEENGQEFPLFAFSGGQRIRRKNLF
jgi:hypothetical protein